MGTAARSGSTAGARPEAQRAPTPPPAASSTAAGRPDVKSLGRAAAAKLKSAQGAAPSPPGPPDASQRPALKARPVPPAQGAGSSRAPLPPQVARSRSSTGGSASRDSSVEVGGAASRAPQVPASSSAKAKSPTPPRPSKEPAKAPVEAEAEINADASDDLDQQLDAAVDALQSIDQRAPMDAAEAEHDDASDARAAEETFIAVAGAHALPLRQFMGQLALGATPRRWAKTSKAALQPLLEGSRQMGLEPLVEAFGAFETALERAAEGTGAYLDSDARQELRAAYATLVERLPDAFPAENGSDGRERFLLESLLLQVPSVRRRTLDRLYAAGLQSLEHLQAASSDELAQVTGLAPGLAAAIAKRITRFEHERAELDPAEMQQQLRDKLEALSKRLARLQSDFEEADEAGRADEKRIARRSRTVAALELETSFAQLGELALVEELRRSATAHKIARVEAYLERAQAGAELS